MVVDPHSAVMLAELHRLIMIEDRRHTAQCSQALHLMLQIPHEKNTFRRSLAIGCGDLDRNSKMAVIHTTDSHSNDRPGCIRATDARGQAQHKNG